MNAFLDLLEAHGADPSAIFTFEESVPELLSYTTLLDARASGDTDLSALRGVYEWQHAPLAFFLDGDQIGNDPQCLRRIRRRLAMRGDAPYLGVVRPGQLTFYHLALDAHAPEQVVVSIPSDQPRATLAYLANQRPTPASTRRQWISQVVLKLLDGAIQDLQEKSAVESADAISLVGRALLARFLADRNLLPLPLVLNGEQRPECLFDDGRRAEATSQWLDDTFNGDFLPLSPGLFERLPAEAYRTLGHILHQAPGGQLQLDWKEDWAHLDFAHIPVGVLSQAYENHLSKHQIKQRKEGGYYTPSLIADLMVRGAFHALFNEGGAHNAKVLDPAAGAGVFLLTAFRQLVAERWRHDGKRPDTKTLREILYGQIVGFDINESALRFAALGLYLLSIELDPHPTPVTKLRFENNLRDTVLHKVGEDSGDTPSASLGSLGDAVGREHVGRYDLVIGNPPWSSATQLPGWKTVLDKVASIARARLPADSPAPPLPNEVMDLPFVWRAMEWARPGGQIAFALHARVLFLQAQGMFEARAAVFSALDVTGVVNGAELAGGPVWPGVSVPFCLLFARNRPATSTSAFRFISPHREDRLNKAGGFRVDARNAEWVTAEQVSQRPEILKILFRGGALDLEIFDRMAARGQDTLDSYWGNTFGTTPKGLQCAGNGYQPLRPSTKKPMPAKDMLGSPTIPEKLDLPLSINVGLLTAFNQPLLHRARNREIYRAPLLIVRESPSALSDRIRVSVSDEDVVFNESYNGYSAYQHPDGRRLVRYLAMLMASRPAYWYVLMTSGRFGIERREIEKMIFEAIPVVPFEDLDSTALEQINPLFEALSKNESEDNWAKVDIWAAEIYGLRRRDLDVIGDTLRLNLPYESSWDAAQATPETTELKVFQDTLEEELTPWVERAGKRLDVEVFPVPAASPWRLIRIAATDGARTPNSLPWPDFFQAADQLAASEVLLPDPEAGCLWVGRLNQARYWSRSQARLLTRRIVWEQIQMLTGQA